MPYNFQLPTTSTLPYPTFISSTTHPSLPFVATTYRDVIRSVLKKHKRLPLQSRASDLTNVLSALEGYAPYLFAISAGLSGKEINGEEIEITLIKEIEVEWRTSLAANIPGREAPRVNGKGLDYEICFVLTTLAYVYTLLAQSQLHGLYSSKTPSTEERTAIITGATKYLLKSNSVHAYLASYCDETKSPPSAIELIPSTQGALTALALAEATLLAVLKDDPFPAVVQQIRNDSDDEWKFKAPEIPKIRAHLGARLCLAAAEHAGKAEAMLKALTSKKASGVDEALIKYADGLARTSKAKACRLFGINAELGGETGQGIAWLIAGRRELGFAGKGEESLRGLAKWKKEWAERREDRNIEKGGEWGGDAGKFEEARILEMLETKWNKMNSTVSIDSTRTVLTTFNNTCRSTPR